MAGSKLSQAKQGAVEFAKQAWGKGYSVGLIQFASSAQHTCELQKQAGALQSRLELMAASGSTNMAEGIELAAEHLAKQGKPRVLVLVTDGQPDSCEAAIKAAQKAKEHQIDIIAIGTDDADQALLRTLASRTELALEVVASQLTEGIASAARMLPGARTTGNPS
jgi:Mg-chelatase subunit ChlD